MFRAVGIIVGFGGIAFAAGPYSPVPPARQPLRFEDHQGEFIARGPAYKLTIKANQNVLVWNNPTIQAAAALTTTFPGANSEARIVPETKMASVSNYFLGNSPHEWRTGVANYEKVRIQNIYRGVDLLFYGKEGSLEYDFVLNPGADAKFIGFEMGGARKINLTPGGDLVLSTGAGEIHWKKPVIYQESEKARRRIAGGFRIRGKRVSFWTGEYDHSRPLVIDPVLAYATYFGAQYGGAGGFES